MGFISDEWPVVVVYVLDIGTIGWSCWVTHVSSVGFGFFVCVTSAVFYQEMAGCHSVMIFWLFFGVSACVLSVARGYFLSLVGWS
jgi:hypothetical protein